MIFARAFLVSFAIVAAAPEARAQSAAGQAETLFRQGRDLMSAGKLAEACAAFESSQKLAPAVTTLLNLAGCREKNQQLASAWGLFVEAERQTRTATDDAGQQLHKLASDKAAALEPRLSRLTIRVPADHQLAGLEVRRDDELVDAGAWNHALPLDGGTYTIVARAPGREPWSTRVTIKPEADAQTIEVPQLGEQRLLEAAPRSSALPVALGITAIALGGGALGFHLWGNSIYDDAKRERDLTTQTSLWHSANTRRYMAQGLGVAAIGCATAAIFVYVRRRGSESGAPASRATISVVAAPEVAGIVVQAPW